MPIKSKTCGNRRVGSRRRRPISVMVSVLLAALLLSPESGMAFHEDVPLLAEKTIEGPFWFAWRIRIDRPGTTAAHEIFPDSENAQQVGYGLYALRVSDRQRMGFIIGTGDIAMTEAHVDDDETDLHHEVGPVAGYTGPTNGFTTTATDLEPGDYWFVVVNTAPWADVATIRLYGDEGVSLVATSQGTRGDLDRETDFDAPHNVQVRAGAGNLAPGAHIGQIRDGKIEIEVEHRLFGIYRSSGADPSDLSHVYPDGTEIRNKTVLMDGPPGTYVFKVNDWRAINAGLGGQSYIALLTADVELPEPLIMTDNAFLPQALALGEGWVLGIENTGQELHSFTVDGAEIDVDVPAGESVSRAISLDPGSYLFRCKYHADMTGELTVRPA